jgi:hypothetical protein
MKRLLFALTLSLSLAGCATFQSLQTALELGTASIANPVTKTRLNQMESAVTLVFAGLETWKDTCEQGVIPPACHDQIGAVQVYTRQLKPYLARLRTFVRTNDQVNAVAVFNEVVDLIGTVKSQAAAGGVTIKTTTGS